mgnify:CR=1 FL=1
MRIVFMGTPDFAVPSLQALLDAGHEVAAVYTQPDKPQGRKQILTAPPVKELALAHGIPVFQPDTLKKEEEQARLRELAPEVIIVVAYGKLLPKAVLDIPPRGCINVHGSLLPRWRGAASATRSYARCYPATSKPHRTVGAGHARPSACRLHPLTGSQCREGS